jgi:serine/threonine protein kinase
VGRVVGRGGFCVVQEVKGLEANNWGDGSSVSGFISRMVKSKKLAPQNRSNRSLNQAGKASTVSDRASGSEASVVDMKKRDPRRTERRKYVLKRMSLEHPDKITFLKGTVDLAMESRFLASLDHVNIIRLHGVSGDGPFVPGYFLILEKMKEILPKRIKKWMDTDRQCKGLTGVFAGSTKKLRTLQSERIATALDIARGSDYLHQRKIIFRDLVSMFSFFCPDVSCVIKTYSRIFNNYDPTETRQYWL